MSEQKTNFEKALEYALLLSGVLARASTSMAIVNSLLQAASAEGRDLNEAELTELRERRKKAEAEFLALMPPGEEEAPTA